MIEDMRQVKEGHGIVCMYEAGLHVSYCASTWLWLMDYVQTLHV